MDISLFQERMDRICALAWDNGGRLTYDQLYKFLRRMDLGRKQLIKLLDYIKEQGIIIGDDDTDGKDKRRNDNAPVELTLLELSYWKEYMTQLENNKEHGRSTKVLFMALANGNEKAKKTLAQRYLPEAAKLARQMNCEEIFLGDLIQEANLSLLTALEKAGSERRNHEWLIGEIQGGIRRAIKEQRRRKEGDHYLVEKVRNLEAALMSLNDYKEDEEKRLTVEELAVVLDMDVEEIEDVLRLTGDDNN